MKFHQLRPGARFRYRNAILRKISPLRAESETDDSPVLIARSAEVVLLDDAGQAVPAKLPETLSAARVQTALEQFLSACARATDRIDPPLSDAQRAQLAQAFNAAGHDLLTRLAAPE